MYYFRTILGSMAFTVAFGFTLRADKINAFLLYAAIAGLFLGLTLANLRRND